METQSSPHPSLRPRKYKPMSRFNPKRYASITLENAEEDVYFTRYWCINATEGTHRNDTPSGLPYGDAYINKPVATMPT